MYVCVFVCVFVCVYIDCVWFISFYPSVKLSVMINSHPSLSNTCLNMVNCQCILLYILFQKKHFCKLVLSQVVM